MWNSALWRPIRPLRRQAAIIHMAIIIYGHKGFLHRETGECRASHGFQEAI
jgi:hypothetical protein